ncbi:6-pyruvoyl tetrahydrobiopterin synthase-like [Contarinia nasturtii]|uniref:6-pyruvoyl tetrahydrobiopterin synthase-like n=1 Tax=Contarinia nasturtii TaxID=265458 RepID=UPI0012D41F91|nr:6-pyruvoyl tetrahydrobiopterin synthase-like [Contarinia nasturtii]
MAPIATLSCKESFTISHYLNSPHLSNTANKKVYGECANPAVHSHQYTIEVITRGTVDTSIGTVMSLSDLKSLLRTTVANQLNRKNLDYDINFFRTVPSTIENLAIFIWQAMKQEMSEPELLYEVKLTDNEENCVIYNGSGGHVQRNGQMNLTSDTD